MGTRNFLFSPAKAKYFVLTCYLALAACSGLRTREDLHGGGNGNLENPPTESAPNQPPHFEAVHEVPGVMTAPTPPQEASPIPALPKIGLILGPGGARAYGHIGVLQNLNRLKVPIHATVGIEWGSPVAALLSSKGQIYDVEWQMFKMREDDLFKKSLIGSSGKMNDVGALKDFLQTAFGKQKVEDFRHPFACPAYNIAKNQVYMMSRGSVEQLLPYCLPYPPLFKPYNHNVSAMREIHLAADYLRSQGANYILLVNVLGHDAGRHSLTGEADTASSILWSEIASTYAKSAPGVDAEITVDLDGYSVMDFDKKREILQKSTEASQKAVDAWAKRFGF